MPHHDTLSETLRSVIQRASREPVRVGDVFKELHQDGFCLVCVIHVLPFLQPISLGPLAFAAGASLTALGLQMLRGATVPWIPERMALMTPSEKTWRILLRTCERVLAACRKIARPRWSRLAVGPVARKLAGATILTGGILLAIPVAGVPFTNTLPALAVLFACIAEMEEDGLFMIAAFVMLLLSVAYFIFLGWAAVSATAMTFRWFSA